VEADPKLPQHPDVERAILGALLVFDSALRKVDEFLTASDFFVVAHRRIFIAMQMLARNGQVVEEVALCDALQNDPEVAIAGGAAYIARLADGIYRNAPVAHVAGERDHESARDSNSSRPGSGSLQDAAPLFPTSILAHQLGLCLHTCFTKDCHHRTPVRKG